MMSSWSLSCLYSLSISILSLSCYSRLVLSLSLLSIEFYSLSVINYFSIMNRLSDIFLSWSIDSSSLNILFSLNLSSNRRVINISCLSSLDVYILFDSLNCRLDNCLSNSRLSRNIYIYGFGSCLVINNWFFSYPLSVYRSVYHLSSLYRSLNDSLFNYRLTYNGFSYHWLRDNLSSNHWFALY